MLNVARSASELKAAEQIENLGDSAEVSSDSVDDLSSSLDNLSDSSKGLETFLASFDEVNKVGGGSLMSNLVTTQDLANILGAATGIEDLQNSLNSLSIPDIGEGTIFDADWWAEKGELIAGFIETFFDPDEFWDNWKRGVEAIDKFIEEMMPKWHSYFLNLGAEIYDALHPDAEKDTRETFTFTDKWGNQREALKYNDDGSLSQAYLNQNKIAAQSTVTNQTVNNVTQNNPIDVTLLLDGRKIASVVTDLQNAKAKSSGSSPVAAN